MRKSNLQPFLIGAADAGLLKAVGELGLPAAGIDPDLDVWSYKRKPRENKEVYEMKSEWKYATISSSTATQQQHSKAAAAQQGSSSTSVTTATTTHTHLLSSCCTHTGTFATTTPTFWRWG